MLACLPPFDPCVDPPAVRAVDGCMDDGWTMFAVQHPLNVVISRPMKVHVDHDEIKKDSNNFSDSLHSLIVRV